MSRVSSDEIRNRVVYNGFDYELQVWVLEGIIQDCGHPEAMKTGGPWNGPWGRKPCCAAHQYAGKRLADVPGHEVRR